MPKICRECLKEIKEKHIKPIPRSLFVVRSMVLWVIIFTLLILGSSAIGILMLQSITHTTWDIYNQLDESFIHHLLECLPFFWLGLSVVAWLLVWYHFRLTGMGYHYRNRYVIVSIGLISIIFGLGFYSLGIGEQVEVAVTPYLPEYLFNSRISDDWMNPESGLLTGKVESIDSINNLFYIKDTKGNAWLIKATSLPENLETSYSVNLVGEKENIDTFRAKEIRVWNNPPLR